MYLRLEKETNKLILIFVFGVCLLLGLRDIVGLEINKFIIVAFCSICFFVSNFKNLVLMVSFLIPWYARNIFNAVGITFSFNKIWNSPKSYVANTFFYVFRDF